MASSSKRQVPQPSKRWKALRDGCIVWMCDKSWAAENLPGLTNKLRAEDWVYGHPCVVIDHSKRDTGDQVVKVAPVTSSLWGLRSDYLAIHPAEAIGAGPLVLRNQRTLKMPSYVKKTCFEVDLRMLRPFIGAKADAFRLTEESMRELVAQMPPAVKWSTQPASRLPKRCEFSPDITSTPCVDSSSLPASHVEEAQSLLRTPNSMMKRNKGPVKRIFVTMMFFNMFMWLIYLVLGILLLLILIPGLAVRFVADVGWKGPGATLDAISQLLLVLTQKTLVDIFADYGREEVV